MNNKALSPVDGCIDVDKEIWNFNHYSDGRILIRTVSEVTFPR